MRHTSNDFLLSASDAICQFVGIVCVVVVLRVVVLALMPAGCSALQGVDEKHPKTCYEHCLDTGGGQGDVQGEKTKPSKTDFSKTVFLSHALIWQRTAAGAAAASDPCASPATLLSKGIFGLMGDASLRTGVMMTILGESSTMLVVMFSLAFSRQRQCFFFLATVLPLVTSRHGLVSARTAVIHVSAIVKVSLPITGYCGNTDPTELDVFLAFTFASLRCRHFGVKVSRGGFFEQTSVSVGHRTNCCCGLLHELRR